MSASEMTSETTTSETKPTKQKPQRVFDKRSSVLKVYPELKKCISLTEASRVLFGVKTLTHLVREYMSADKVKDVRDFFDNPSDLVQWGKHVTDLWYFSARPEHRKVYKAMVIQFGIALAARLTLDRDYADIVTGYQFLKADKKRWAQFEKNILANLKLFPEGSHAKMIHDYCVDRMKAAERSNKPRGPVQVTLPVPAVVPEAVDGLQVLVPKNETDLRRIGTAQHHCVGTKGMGYADKVRRGQIWIFALYTKNLSDGVCVEVDARDGYVMQAQGRHRRNPSDKEDVAIQTVIKSLVKRETTERIAQ